jgi:hypothetical protein
MKSKDILSIIAFISAFAVSAAFASLFTDKSQYNNYNIYAVRSNPNCQDKNPTCTEMLSLLVRDNIIGAERQRSYDYSLSETGNVSPKRAESVAEYADEASNMNVANLPSEFRTEWREHMQAWRDYSNFLNEVSQNKIEDAEFSRLENRYLREINDSYDDVLKFAKTYGVNNEYVY